MTYNGERITHFIASGAVRGDCGHKHKTLEAAERCADGDRQAVSSRNHPGYYTRAYSDRIAWGVTESGTRYAL